MKLPRHSLRIREVKDWQYVAESPGALDGVMINANVLEHRAAVFACRVADSSLPFMVDPVLWRFQVPAWWMRQDGVTTKSNFVELARRYSVGTGIHMGSQPLLNWVNTDSDWARLATNVVRYERERLLEAAGSLFLHTDYYARQPFPIAIIAPYLLARSRDEDRINRMLLDASAEELGAPVVAHLALPLERALDPNELSAALGSVDCDAADSVIVWISGMTEERLLATSGALSGFLGVLERLGSRDKEIGHAHAGFAAIVLRDRGLHALVHRLHWTDDGMPAEPGGGRAACTTYATVLHYALPSDRALALIPSNPQEYVQRFCSCFFCRGAVAAGEHPMDMLLEAVEMKGPRGGTRLTPSESATMANRFHFLWSRTQEIESVEEIGPHEYLYREIERAGSLGVQGGRFARLADVV